MIRSTPKEKTVLSLEIRFTKLGLPPVGARPADVAASANPAATRQDGLLVEEPYQMVVIGCATNTGRHAAGYRTYPEVGQIFVQLRDNHLDDRQLHIVWSQASGTWLVQDLDSLSGTKLDEVPLRSNSPAPLVP